MKIRLNNNEEIVSVARKALEDNNYYCPCALEKNSDTKCMCKDFKDRVAHGYAGECNCGLYVSEPHVVCLCGSTKFKDLFMIFNRAFTEWGYIVLAPGVFIHQTGEEVDEELKNQLDKLHKEKIDMSDMIFIINKNGYIGESTKNEIEYAKKHNKIIQYMEDIE